MPALFHPRLVNDPFNDPALFIPLSLRKQALLFDLGDLTPLSAREILKLSHIFISHTHIDHFIGFDQVLRLLLGRPKTLHLYGPRGFLDNINGKLRAYTWNLVESYSDALVIHATELVDGHRRTQSFECRKAFVPDPVRVDKVHNSVVLDQPEFQVTTAQLDHRTPCLGYCVQERFHVNVMKTRVEALGLSVGPWLAEFKHHLYLGSDPDLQIAAPLADRPAEKRMFKLKALADDIARITEGQKTAYVADAVYSPDNENKILQLAWQADHLFIEAVFLDSERDIARAKYHLTAKQAGTIARKAGVKQMTIFHHSPRYLGNGEMLELEARQAFAGE